MHRSPLQGLDILEIGDEQFPASLEYDDKYDLEMVCAIHLCFSHYHSTLGHWADKGVAEVSGEDMLEFVKQKLGIRVGAGTGRSSVKRRPEDSDLWQGHNQIYTIRCDDTRKVNIDAYFVQRYDTRESWPTSPTDLRQRGRRVQKQQERLFYCWSEGELGKGDRGSSTTTILAYNPMASCPLLQTPYFSASTFAKKIDLSRAVRMDNKQAKHSLGIAVILKRVAGPCLYRP
ncbi:uncharacterized protein [Aegilops tauschii subsp. strangulata]|uniref:uncharacterized protein isoform X3 n=1 Tax=Aegilops tauschii subsp. strangulata TaxID=200361 RepID=UPI003CC8DE7B